MSNATTFYVTITIGWGVSQKDDQCHSFNCFFQVFLKVITYVLDIIADESQVTTGHKKTKKINFYQNNSSRFGPSVSFWATFLSRIVNVPKNSD